MLGISFDFFVLSSPLFSQLIHNRNICMLFFRVNENLGGNGGDRADLEDLDSGFYNVSPYSLFVYQR